MNKLKQINQLAMEIVNDEEGSYHLASYRLADMNAQRIVLLTQPIQLNEDQKIVLEWLKAYSDSDNGDKPISSIWYMLHLISENLLESRVRNSYFNLTEKQQFEVLQAFAEWGLSNDK